MVLEFSSGMIKTISLVYESVVDSIMSAGITIGDFRMIEQYGDKINQRRVLSSTYLFKDQDIGLELNRRSKEHLKFTNYLMELTKFWQMCKASFPVGKFG